MNDQEKAEFVAGSRAIIPLAVGVAMYGLAFGLLATQAGFDWIDTGLMGALVFAGSAPVFLPRLLPVLRSI